jgi:DNA-binding transcriptional MerR regulator
VIRPARARSHRSIGEVLSLLQEEYPDVTISKIRFLESQGLLDPERTPSGYRKFYDTDINRLRWILQQQKEHYLPLKVIKERLDQSERDVPRDVPPRDVPPRDDAMHLPFSAGAHDDLTFAPHANGHTRNGAIGHDRDRDSPTSPRGPSATNGAVASTSSRPPPWSGSSAEGSAAAPHGAGSGSGGWSLEELCEASGISARDVRHLERFGLLEAHEFGDERIYTSDALTVARVAARFLQHGIEARHMRTYKVAVDREASLFEQIVLPVLKQRNPEARRRAAHTVAELIDMGDVLRGVLLRRELRGYLDAKD